MLLFYKPQVYSFASFEEWPPQLGVLFETSVLCWSFAESSFWRGKSVSMAEVISYAKSMALTRFREAGVGGSGEVFLTIIQNFLWREIQFGEKFCLARRSLTFSPVKLLLSNDFQHFFS